MYTTNDRVSYSRITDDGCLGIAETVNALQDCALFHSEDIGHSAAYLAQKNRAWLVSYWDVVFVRRPKMAEYFTVKTWVYKVSGVFGCRNFLMETKDGETLAYADSRWFYFDSSKGMPARIDEGEIEAYTPEPAYDMEYSSRKVALPDGLKLIDKTDVNPSLLDTNHHMNNGQYVRLATGLLPDGWYPSRMRCEYRNAAKLSDTLYMKRTITGDHIYVVFTDDDNNPYFISDFTRG